MTLQVESYLCITQGLIKIKLNLRFVSSQVNKGIVTSFGDTANRNEAFGVMQLSIVFKD